MLDEPLGLTVHSLPHPREAAERDSRRTASGRLKMLLVLAVCAAPVIASYFTYYVIRPEGRRNYGELIDPQRPLPAITATVATSQNNQRIELPALRGQWLLASVAGGACDAACEKNLYLQRQLREGLGKDKDRVDWVWFVTDDAPLRPELIAALPQATVLRVDRAQLAQWLAPSNGHALNEHLYLIDPMGNWMMRFPPAGTREVDLDAAKNIKKDMERVLRASASWDQAGRPAR